MRQVTLPSPRFWEDARPGRYISAAAGRAAFTLIEILIVIVIIALLISVIALVGSHVHHQQKVKYTETIMRGVTMAIDQFVDANPLGSVYDRRPNAGPDKSWGTSDDVVPSFGAYPPYQLCSNAVNTVGGIVEPANLLPGDYTLGNRLHRDFANRLGDVFSYVSWGTRDPNDGNLDIRALYIYLTVYAPGSLAQVPQDRIKPLDPNGPEMVNPAGTYVNPTNPGAGAVDVFGIQDAWGVPLDYFLYVKLEYGAKPYGSGGYWRVADRIPVLRSRGSKLEVVQAQGDKSSDWIFSTAFPSPPAMPADGNFWSSGLLTGADTSCNGWARAIGGGDLATTGGKNERSFGYVP